MIYTSIFRQKTSSIRQNFLYGTKNRKLLTTRFDENISLLSDKTIGWLKLARKRTFYGDVRAKLSREYGRHISLELCTHTHMRILHYALSRRFYSNFPRAFAVGHLNLFNLRVFLGRSVHIIKRTDINGWPKRMERMKKTECS